MTRILLFIFTLISLSAFGGSDSRALRSQIVCLSLSQRAALERASVDAKMIGQPAPRLTSMHSSLENSNQQNSFTYKIEFELTQYRVTSAVAPSSPGCTVQSITRL